MALDLKRIAVLGLVIAALVGVYYVFSIGANQVQQGKSGGEGSYRDLTYMIEGKPVKLTGGYAESSPLVDKVAGSASKTITRYFGNEAEGDIDGDGVTDVAFLLTQEGGGSGTFFYVAAALKKGDGYLSVDATIIGDRIAPQPTEIRDGIVIVNYADRAPGEPMTARPSVGKSLYLKLDPETLQFGEVVQNFEGEADPARMTLGMKSWVWVSALYNDGRTIAPKKSGAFTLTFQENGRFSATTDCNGLSGSYTAKDGAITFSDMVSTLMYCEGSEEGDFQSLLANTSGYHFTSKGELILDLKYDSGTVRFR